MRAQAFPEAILRLTGGRIERWYILYDEEWFCLAGSTGAIEGVGFTEKEIFILGFLLVTWVI